MQNKFDGLLPTFMFRMTDFLNVMNENVPYMQMSNGVKDNRKPYVCWQEKRRRKLSGKRTNQGQYEDIQKRLIYLRTELRKKRLDTS